MAEELEEGLDLSTEQDLDPNTGTDNAAETTNEGVAEGEHYHYYHMPKGLGN